MDKKTEDKLCQIIGITIAILICAFIVFGIGMCTRGLQEQYSNTTYEFEVIEKYEKIGSRFLSGGETEYHIIYKRRELYKNTVSEDWKHLMMIFHTTNIETLKKTSILREKIV